MGAALVAGRLVVATALSGLLVTSALASLAPSSAQAADICVGHPSEPSVVCVRNNDTIVDVCDRDNDTHRVYARVVTRASSPNFQSPFYDDNGSNPGCGNFNFPSGVLSVAVCVQTEGCSAFKQTGPSAAPSVPPPAPPPPAAPPGAAAPAGAPVIYAAGDISCTGPQRENAQEVARQGKKPKTCQSLATYNKIRELERQRGNPGLPDAVLALGDIQYETGAFNSFMANYQLDWGPLKPNTYPALGNHEYKDDGGKKENDRAEGYWEYFEPAPPAPQPPTDLGAMDEGWYAFDVGSWRAYAINSNCTRGRGNPGVVSCARGSKQYNWLLRDMRENPRACRLMFMHHPYWDSSKDNFNTPALRPLIGAFSARGGDVVLAGHAHDYERFARSNANQQPVSSRKRGFRMFIVGTGGKNLRSFAKRTRKNPRPLEPNSKARNNTDFGVLQLRLGDPTYQWRFVSAYNTKGGVFADSGTGRCR